MKTSLRQVRNGNKTHGNAVVQSEGHTMVVVETKALGDRCWLVILGHCSHALLSMLVDNASTRVCRRNFIKLAHFTPSSHDLVQRSIHWTAQAEESQKVKGIVGAIGSRGVMVMTLVF